VRWGGGAGREGDTEFAQGRVHECFADVGLEIEGGAVGRVASRAPDKGMGGGKIFWNKTKWGEVRWRSRALTRFATSLVREQGVALGIINGPGDA